MAVIFPDNHNEKQQFNLGENLNLVFSFNKYSPNSTSYSR